MFDHDPARPAAWYVRVLESPTCRWVQWSCLENEVDCATETPLTRCCDPSVARTHQERAWTSPIFYEPL